MKKDIKAKEFEMPKADVILFDNEDVITSSNETPGMPYFFGNDGDLES